MNNKPDEKCAPSKKYTDGSCFTLESLQRIAKAYNNKYGNKIKITDNKKELVKSLEDNLSKKCDDQVCWLKQEFTKEIMDESMKNTFRPKGPSTGYDWLSTTDIDKVMEQYHEKYQDFIYLGTVPSDFEELPVLKLNNIDFEDLRNRGKKRIGMVINLDEHYKSGSHWVALYSDLERNKLYYFDSFGKGPKENIRKFISKIAKYLYKNEYGEETKHNFKHIIKGYEKMDKMDNEVKEKLGKIDIRYNKVQHQFDNSECGVYSMNFIIRLLKGESFDEITNNITKDREMNQCRRVYFR